MTNNEHQGLQAMCKIQKEPGWIWVLVVLVASVIWMQVRDLIYTLYETLRQSWIEKHYGPQLAFYDKGDFFWVITLQKELDGLRWQKDTLLG